MEKNAVLQRVHELELKIALEIRRICEKHHIPYFLTAGTLLGAIRHGGFIPWDDDMDIGMLRSDYDRFLRACQEELGDAYFLQTWDTDPEYPFSFAKIRLNGTHFVEGFSQAGTMHDGIFVDIFPFDSAPDEKIARKLQGYKYFLCKRLLWIKKGLGTNMKSPFSQAVKYYLFRFLSCFFSYRHLKAYFQKVQTKYNHLHTQKIVTDGSYPYSRESIDRCWAEHLTTVSFEGEEFTTYQDWEAYLRTFYGDYMQLPPEDKRNRHLLLNVDFGPYAQE